MTGFKNVQSQMFDVRPTTQNGKVDFEKINQAVGVLDLSSVQTPRDIKEKEEAAKLTRVVAQARAREKEKSQEIKITIRKKISQAETVAAPKAIETPKPLFDFQQEDLRQNEYFAAQIGKPEEVIEEIEKEAEGAVREQQKEKEETREEHPYRLPEQLPLEKERKPQIPLFEQGQKDDSNYFDLLLPSLEKKSSLGQKPHLESEKLPTKEELLDELNSIEQEEIGFKTTLASKPKIEIKEKKKEKVKLQIKEKEEKSEFQALADKVSLNLDGAQDLFVGGGQAVLVKKKPFKLPTFKLPEISKAVFLSLALGLIISAVIFSFVTSSVSIKNKLLGSNLSAYQHLLETNQSLSLANWDISQNDFFLAHQNFYTASKKLNEVSGFMSAIVDALGRNVSESGKSLLAAAENIASANNNFSQAVSEMALLDFTSVLTQVNDPAYQNQKSNTEILSKTKLNLEQAKSSLKAAKQDLERIDASLTTVELKKQTDNILEQLPSFEEVIDQSVAYLDFAMSLLGKNDDRRYLLIFQNSSEARATGGLIDSYGILELANGNIKDLKVEGIYNLDSQLKEKIIPPKPLQKISTAWSTHDANWFADFPTSAEKVIWFFERSSGLPVDGVISITPTVIERLLSLTGPIEMPEYSLVLNDTNFVEEIQYKMEEDFDRELNQPQKILSDFTPKFLSALKNLSLGKQEEAKKILVDLIDKRFLMTFFTDNDLQGFASDHGWAGQLQTVTKDFLSVVSSNIGDDKTDRYIDQRIEHRAEIQNDGSIIDTVTILRKHNGGKTNYLWYNQTNINYLRVYVPLGSTLISAKGNYIEKIKAPIDYLKQGFVSDSLVQSIENNLTTSKGTDIFSETGKTVFGNWVQTKAGRTSKLVIKYKLPFKVNLTRVEDEYMLYVQKQAGAKDAEFSTSISAPDNWQIISRQPQDWAQTAILDKDLNYSARISF